MNKDIIKFAKEQQLIEPATFLAFLEVETGGKGFDSLTQKILIQFEPKWFRKKEPYAPSGNWSVNKVDVQREEWKAFNEAFKISPDSAMESTSIGIGQIMGFHWERLGYDNVGEMWDEAKASLQNQLIQVLLFISSDERLINAIRHYDWHKVASIYNGANYQELAKRLGREPYDLSLQKAYLKYRTI